MANTEFQFASATATMVACIERAKVRAEAALARYKELQAQKLQEIAVNPDPRD